MLHRQPTAQFASVWEGQQRSDDKFPEKIREFMSEAEFAESLLHPLLLLAVFCFITYVVCPSSENVLGIA